MAKDPKHRYKDCAQVVRDLSALGMHGQPLSFIDGATAPGIGGGSQSPIMGAMGATVAGDVASLTRAGGQATQADSARTWYVQYHTQDGKPMMEKFSTRRVIKMINAGVLTPKSRAKASSDGSYLPLAQFAEFTDAIDQQLARRAATGKNEDMESLYKQVDRAEKSRLRWRWLKNKMRGLVGGIGLIIWIVTILVVGGVLYFAGNVAFESIGGYYNEFIGSAGDDGNDGLDIKSDTEQKRQRESGAEDDE